MYQKVTAKSVKSLELARGGSFDAFCRAPVTFDFWQDEYLFSTAVLIPA